MSSSRTGEYGKALVCANESIKITSKIVKEGKDAAETVKTSYLEYKDAVAEIKTAVDAKDWKKTVALSSALAKKITDRVPADQLEGTTKTIYDNVNAIVTNANEGKYDKVIDMAEVLIKLFDKKD